MTRSDVNPEDIYPQRLPPDPAHPILSKIRERTQYLHSADIVVIGFVAALSVINILGSSRIPYWWLMVLVNIGVVGFILWLGFARHTCGYRIIRIAHDWFVALFVFFSFKELYFMIRPLHLGQDYDSLLIAADRWLFGVNPTQWLMQFATPWLTEILQIAYTAFYLLFLMLGYEIYRKKQYDRFHFFMFTCAHGFFLSYLGYLFLPAVGPRFTLHDFPSLSGELPGLWLTEPLRWFVNSGESVLMNVPNDVAMASAQRDVFPSGHTMMTLVLMYIGFEGKAKVRWVIYIVGTLLIIATVYQRYHYVIDLIGGAVFAVIAIVTAKPAYHFTRDKLQTLERNFPRDV
jgi:membrane-associated phospholipid phosphatase